MIRLKDLLFESPASEKAKKLGYTHDGGGVYLDKSGKAVARSKNGELVPYQRTEKEPRKRKRSGASALSQKLTPSGPVEQFIATEGNAHKGGDGGTGSGMSKEDFKAWLQDDAQSAMEDPEIAILLDLIDNEIVPGEELKIWGIVDEDPEDTGGRIANRKLDENEFRAMMATDLYTTGGTPNNYYIGFDESLNKKSTELYKGAKNNDYKQTQGSEERGAQQIKEWRSKIPVTEQAELLGYCWEWQIDSQYKVKEERKRERNIRLNAITKDGELGPATTTLVGGQMDRGMTVDTEKVKDFLENFQIGKDTVMPPSGFTQRSGYAHIYSSGDTALKQCGVHLRLHANNDKGEIVGLNLTGFRELNPQIDQRGRDYQEDLVKQYSKLGRGGDNIFQESGMDETLTNGDWYPLHQTEAEIIRPGWVGQKTMKVEKHVFIKKRVPRWSPRPQGPYEVSVKYIIDMVDTGEVAPAQIQEVKMLSRKALALLKYYTNGTVRNKKKKKMKKESKMPTLRQLLYELTPSQEAKKLGLKHTAFGRYADSTGQIVAMSRNGKLVRLSGEKEKPKRKKSKKKIDKDNALNGGDGGTGSGIGFQQFLRDHIGTKINKFGAISANPAVKGEVVKIWQLAEYASKRDTQDLAYEMRHKELYRITDLALTMAKRENREREKETLPGSPERKKLQYEIRQKWKGVVADFKAGQRREKGRGVEDAQEQSATRKKWSLDDQAQMLGVQAEWQYNSQYTFATPEERRKRNEFINSVFKKYDVAKVKTTGLHRGLSLTVEDFDAFISNFDVGSTVVLPPSGFSSYENIAAQFDNATPLIQSSEYDSRVDDYRVGVRIRIEPVNPDAHGVGEITGLHLSQLANKDGYHSMFLDSLDDELQSKILGGQDARSAEEEMSDMFEDAHIYDRNIGFYFDDEIEVIVPGTVAHEVVSVTRHIITKEGYDVSEEGKSVHDQDAPKVEYQIVLRQTGNAKEGQIMEGLRSKNPKKMLRKYFNSNVAGKRKPKKKKRK